MAKDKETDQIQGNEAALSSSPSLPSSLIPKHVIEHGNKQIYKKFLKRAGLYIDSTTSLSCLNNGVLSQPNQPWLGAASRKLQMEIEAARLEQHDRCRHLESGDVGASTRNSKYKSKSKKGVPIVKDDVGFNIDEIKARMKRAVDSGGVLFDFSSQSLHNNAIIKDGFGKAELPNSNGVLYIGNWKASKPHGHGKAIYPGGSSYEGDWKDGNWVGQGKLINPDGSHYQGNFLYRFHGKGTFVSPTLGIQSYSGMFRNGNVSEWAHVEFSDGETVDKKWSTNARLSLSEAIQKLIKERETAKRRALSAESKRRTST